MVDDHVLALLPTSCMVDGACLFPEGVTRQSSLPWLAATRAVLGVEEGCGDLGRQGMQ